MFLAPLTGIIHFDYYAYRRGKIALSQLYEPSARSSLWYWHGINWRAIVAFIIGQGPLWPGFIARVRHTSYGVGWDRIYNLVSRRSFAVAYDAEASDFHIWLLRVGAGVLGTVGGPPCQDTQ